MSLIRLLDESIIGEITWVTKFFYKRFGNSANDSDDTVYAVGLVSESVWWRLELGWVEKRSQFWVNEDDRVATESWGAVWKVNFGICWKFW
jgi:hypothetical protein